jgi:PilZ domain
MSIEQRRNVRYLAKNNTFAALRNDSIIIGKINDINTDGLAFSFLSETTQAHFAVHHTKVDIFDPKNGFHIHRVPCEIVYDIPDSSHNKGLFVRMSRCGLQFGEITESQFEQLEFFIKNYTTGILGA